MPATQRFVRLNTAWFTERSAAPKPQATQVWRPAVHTGEPWPAAAAASCRLRQKSITLGQAALRPFQTALSASSICERCSSGFQQARRSVRAEAAAAVAVPAAAPAANPLAASLAVLVGWLVIAGSCVRSLPQIIRIVKNKSVQGLSLTSFSSELVCYMVSVAYNITNGYAFSTFGDTAICALQNAAIIGLIFRLGSVPRGVQLGLSASLLACAAWLFGGACPPSVLTALQAGSVALLALGGRLPQILLNLRRGDSGELSLLSCALSLVGNLARVFTTAVLVRDPIILGSAGTQAILNGILTWQTVDTARRLSSSRQESATAAPADAPAEPPAESSSADVPAAAADETSAAPVPHPA